MMSMVKDTLLNLDCIEDPNNDFLPVTGKIKAFQYQQMDGLRVESAIEQGSDISIYYDPMIAKIIVHDDTRAEPCEKWVAYWITWFVLEQ